MILKDYQRRALEAVRKHLEGLTEFRERAHGLDPELRYNWARAAWEQTVPRRPWNERRNGLGQPLPSFCLKIPTGGGKTLLATKVIDLVNVHFRQKQTGLVLLDRSEHPDLLPDAPGASRPRPSLPPANSTWPPPAAP